jgi:hypothetical protein
MRDETKGMKTNRVVLNLAHHGSLEPPEPGVAAVMIDGIPIHAVEGIQITAGATVITRCSIVFECEVSGVIAGKDVEQMIRESRP